MKKLLILMTLLISISSVFAKDWKVVRIGVDPSYPPFESVAPNGQIVGFSIDLTKALCAKMNVKCIWVKQDFDSMIPALRAKKFDVIISSLAITPERAKQIAFSNKLFDAPARMITRTGSGLLPNADSLRGKKVGVQQGTLHNVYADKEWAPKGVIIVPYATQNQVLMDLVSGRLDATFQDAAQADYGFLRTPQGKGFSWAGPPINDPKVVGYGIAIGLRKKDTDLLQLFNKAIASVHQDGTFNALEKKYFSYSIYQSNSPKLNH